MLRTMTILVSLGTAGVAGAELPDPTRPYDYAATVEVQQGTAAADWRLTGIRIRGEDRTAIINGRVVRAGDDLDGAKVVEIGHGQVVLDQDRKRVVLRLLLSTVKQPAGAAGAVAGAN
jgi:MSHA biogenesis protein MshK